MARPTRPPVFIFTLGALIANSAESARAWTPRSAGFWLLNGIASKGESFVLVPGSTGEAVDLSYRKSAEEVLARCALAPTAIRVVPLAYEDDPGAAQRAWFTSLPWGVRQRVRIAFDLIDADLGVWKDLGIDVCGISPGKQDG